MYGNRLFATQMLLSKTFSTEHSDTVGSLITGNQACREVVQLNKC